MATGIETAAMVAGFQATAAVVLGERAIAESRADRREFPMGDYAVKVGELGERFAYEVKDAGGTIVAFAAGFECLGSAESAARKATTAKILETRD